MERKSELHNLSHQHHHGLVAARHLRLAAEGSRPLAEVRNEFLAAWESEIAAHFRAEEEILLPALATALPEDHPLIVRTLTEHVALRRAVRALSAGSELSAAAAAEIGCLLHDHIRFEERELFPAVEAALTPDALAAVGADLARRADTE